nr:reverse transcriptase domain-containing protein [Tanacetum cinerariifolium]
MAEKDALHAFSISVVYVLTTPMLEEGGENLNVEQVRRRAKMLKLLKNYEIPWKPNILPRMPQVKSSLFTQHKINIDESIQVSCIIDKLPPSWKDFKHTLKHLKEELTLIELGSHLRIEKSLRVHDSDKPKGNNVVGPSVVNMVEHNNSSRYNDNKSKRKHYDTRANPNKKSKVTCWKCGKPRHLKKDCKDDDVAWWVDSGATMHVCKDRCWFKTYESVNNRSILHIGNESTALVHGRGCVDLRFSSEKVISLLNVLHVPNIRKNLVSSSVLNNCGYKQVIESNNFVLSKLEALNASLLGYVEHSKAFRFYVIEPNDSVAINYIIESWDDIFDEHRNLFPPFDNPELTIRRRSHTDPTLLNNSEMAAEGNGDLPATNFGLKNDMIQQVHNSCQFYGLPGDDANKHLDKFLHVTQSIKVNGVTDDALHLYLFPHSLTHHATAWFDRLPRNSINTFEQMAKMFLGKYFPPSMVTKLRNEIINFRQRPDESLFEAWERYKLSIDRSLKAEMDEINKNLMRVLQVNQQVKTVTPNCKTYGGPHSFSDCPATVSNTQNVYAAGSYQGNTITNPKEDLKGITTRSGTANQGPMIPTTSSSSLFGPSIKSLLTNNDQLCELDRTPLNKHCSAVLLKKLPEKLGDPDKFLIPCDFLRMAECLALADLGASINLMPLSVWNKLSLPDLSPTCMTLELINHSISHPVGVAEDVFVKVDTFHFPADFVVVDFDADPRVPLILERYFFKTGRALIDVFEGELTLRVGKEAITFNLDQTSRYSANYNDMTANRIDVINMAYEEYSQKVLGFSNVIASGNPTPYYDPIVSTTSSTLTPFRNSDFLLEEVDAFLALEDDPTSSEVDQSYVNTEGDILLLKAFLNDDQSSPPPNQGNYLPQVRKELKICEAKSDKSSIDEPPEEKTSLIMVLKSHKQAIAWKLSDIKGIDPEFCTHKILMEEDFEPTVQHQSRVNPKIHDVIKQEGGFTVVENEKNELILTRLVTGWRVCIDYRKLNEATSKDHFPLPFMDQMLERFTGNQYYCFLDGFSDYFQIPIDPKDQEKTTFTCPYQTFAYRRMPFGLCNAPCTFQRCMMAIFHDMIEKTMEVFMDDFSVFRNSFQTCLSHLERMLKRCEDTNFCLNWEKSHFMVKQGIVLSHKIFKEGIEVDKAKFDVISKLPHPTTVK